MPANGKNVCDCTVHAELRGLVLTGKIGNAQQPSLPFNPGFGDMDEVVHTRILSFIPFSSPPSVALRPFLDLIETTASQVCTKAEIR